MRALPFAIVAVLVLVVQVAVAPHLALTPARYQPQFPLIVLLFVALYARTDAALLGSWTLGLLVDLASIGPLGGFAFAYGLVGLAIVAVRSSVFRSHPLTHFVLAFGITFVANALLAGRQAMQGDWTGVDALLAAPLAVALYTALLAPYAMLLLNPLRRTFRFPDRG